MKELSNESVAAQLQALKAAVMALIAAAPTSQNVADRLDEMALKWEGMAGAQPVPEAVIEETATLLRQLSTFANTQR